MKKAMLVLAVFGLVSSAWAADPIIGKWKLNIAQSKLEGAAPKEFTESYREIDGNMIELTTMWIASNGSSEPEKINFPAQGGINKFLTAAEKGRHEVEILIAPGEWYMAGMQDGKQIMTRHKVISKDGKTMRQTIRHTDSKGKVTEELLIFDRQ